MKSSSLDTITLNRNRQRREKKNIKKGRQVEKVVKDIETKNVRLCWGIWFEINFGCVLKRTMLFPKDALMSIHCDSHKMGTNNRYKSYHTHTTPTPLGLLLLHLHSLSDLYQQCYYTIISYILSQCKFFLFTVRCMRKKLQWCDSIFFLLLSSAWEWENSNHFRHVG